MSIDIWIPVDVLLICLHVFRLLKEENNFIYGYDVRNVKCFKWLKAELMQYDQIALIV